MASTQRVFLGKMPECDVLVIGSGHNGLGLAAYCARAGLDVVVIESAGKIGGFLSTEAVTQPGFKHNLHAVTLGSYAPFYRDFDLQPFGVRFVKPSVEYTLLLPSSHLTIRCADPIENWRAVANFSQRDAKTIEELYRRFHRTWLKEFYSAPRPPGERGEDLSSGERREYNRISGLSFREAVDEFFESEEIKLFFCLRAIEITGDVGLGSKSASPDYPGTGDFLFRLAFDPEYQIVFGGTNELAQGIARLLQSLGARILAGSPVERVLVKDRTAVGVRLANGTIFEARAVVSGANFGSTMLDLVGEEHLDAAFANAVKGLHGSRAGKFDLHLAVTRPPRYRVPEASEALCLFLGYESLADVETRWSEICMGAFPARPAFHCGCTTIYDPASAPPGAHTLYLWQFVPVALSRSFTEAEAPAYLERILARWREYTSDLDEANLLGRYGYYLGNWKTRQAHPYGGVPVSHGHYYHARPLPECADYRTPLRGLYLCGSSSHPGGSVRFGPAYNAAQVVLEDLGLTPWWSRDLTPGTPLVLPP